ncbi:MAG: SPOR domain-containing protein [Saprospiraceae bacterium]|nr:SPOR domain-containing protein [Saprospiraceae bacterium]
MIKQLILPLLLLPYCAMAAFAQPVHFLDGNLSLAQERAVREGKLYFLHFTANWCMPCKWMEENTFTDAVLSDYVNEYYMAVKMDFDSKEAEQYKKLYNVTSLPSLLIFNAKGILIDRHQTSLDATTLLKILYENESKYPAQAVAGNIKISNNNEQISRPALIPDASLNSDYLAASHKPQATDTKHPVTSNQLPAASSEPPVASDQSAPRSAGKYGIQIGVYSELANAKKSQERMERQFKKLVQIDEIQQDGKTLYRVMLGAFESKEAAEKYLLYLDSQSVRGFVKNIDN